MAAVTLIGAGLRFADLGGRSLWLDEAFSVWLAGHSPARLLDWVVRIDQHPPLYALVLSGWVALFGESEAAVRSLSALAGTATVPVLALLALAVTRDRTTAAVAAAFLALAPYHVHHSQQARMYSLLTLLVVIALYAAARLLAEPRGPGAAARVPPPVAWAVALGIAEGLVMLTHHAAAALFPLALNLPVFALWLATRGTGSATAAPKGLAQVRVTASWLWAQGIAVLVWLPWSAAALRQFRGVDERFWVPPPTLASVVAGLREVVLGTPPANLLPGAVLGLAAVLAVAGLSALRSRPEWALILISLLVVPPAGELLISLRRPIFLPRTLLWLLLPLAILVAAGLTSLVRRARSDVFGRVRVAAAGTAAALILVVFLVSLSSHHRTGGPEDWRTAARLVADRAAPGDLVLFNATWVQLPFEYYFRHDRPDVDLHGAPVDLFEAGTLEPPMTPRDVPRLEELVRNRRHVWLVYSHDEYTDPDKLVLRTLAMRYRRASVLHLPGIALIRFEDPAPPPL